MNKILEAMEKQNKMTKEYTEMINKLLRELRNVVTGMNKTQAKLLKELKNDVKKKKELIKRKGTKYD